MEIKDPAELSTEDLVQQLEHLEDYKEELEGGIKLCKDELIDRLKEKKLNGKIVGEKSLALVRRYYFQTELKEAENLGAVKLTIDQSRLRQLFDNGVKLKHKVVEYLMVKNIQRD